MTGVVALAAIGLLLAGHVAVTRWQDRRHWHRFYLLHGPDLIAETQRRLREAWQVGRLDTGFSAEEFSATLSRTVRQMGVTLTGAFEKLGRAMEGLSMDLEYLVGPAVRQLFDLLNQEPPWVANSRLDAELPPIPDDELDVCPDCGELMATADDHARRGCDLVAMILHSARQPIVEAP